MFDKTIVDYAGLEEPYTEMAEDRVIAEPQLSLYHDLLIEEDWPDQEAHWKWVATAPIEELVAWGDVLRADDEADEAEEKPFVYEQVVRHTITMYPKQWQAVMALAHQRYRGKKSPALQKIVDWYIAAPELLAALDGIETVYAEYMALGPDASQRSFELVLEAVRTARLARIKATGGQDDR